MVPGPSWIRTDPGTTGGMPRRTEFVVKEIMNFRLRRWRGLASIFRAAGVLA
jgi:hypothetical protein